MSKNAPSNRPTGRSRGRPTRAGHQREVWGATWSEAALAICAMVAEGSSLRAACGGYQNITPPAFLRWTEQYSELGAAWRKALLTRGNAKFEDVAELADEIAALGRAPKTDTKLKLACLAEAAQLKKWVAAKLDPASYGDRAIGAGVAIQINTSLPISTDPLDDGSGAFTVRVAPGPALADSRNEESEALPVKSGGGPSLRDAMPV